MTEQMNGTSTDVWEDPIVAEVHQVREAISAQYDYDIDRIFAHVRAWEKEHPWQGGDGNIPVAASGR